MIMCIFDIFENIRTVYSIQLHGIACLPCVHSLYVHYIQHIFLVRCTWIWKSQLQDPKSHPTNEPTETNCQFLWVWELQPWKLTMDTWISKMMLCERDLRLQIWHILVSMLIFGGVEACHMVQCRATPIYVYSKRHSSLECQGGPIHLSNSLKQITGSWHITS